jgi:SAM-dependent methyltransferase
MNRHLKGLLKAIVPNNLKPAALKAFYRLRAPFYSGDQVECPCCGGSFSKFLAFTGYHRTRENAQCASCGSLERHRLMMLYLKSKTDISDQPMKVLHFAPEITMIKWLKAKDNVDYTSTDIESPLADILMDIHQITFEDNTFDAILCAHVLDHVGDDRKAMQELRRVMKPGAWALIQSGVDLSREQTFEDPDAVSPQDKLRIYGQIDLARQYGKDFPDRLEKAGFDVREDFFARELGPEVTARYGLLADEAIYFCTNPA